MRRFLLLAAALVLLANLAAVTTGAVDEPPVTPVAVATLPAEDLPPGTTTIKMKLRPIPK